MSYDEDQVRLIRHLIAQNASIDRRTGTIMSRATTGTAATALFDGDTNALPVKCPGDLHVLAGDRVTLDRYGHDWIVTHNEVRRGLGEANSSVVGVSSGTTSSSSYVDYPGTVTCVFPKMYDSTAVRIGVVAGLRITSPGTMFLGVNINGSDFDMVKSDINTANNHWSYSAARRFTHMTAGLHTCVLRWKRTSGGDLAADGNDSANLEVDEIYRWIEPAL